MRRRLVIPENRETKALVVALCSYEITAIVSDYVKIAPTIPTLTALHRRWPAVGIALIGALAVHFWTPDDFTLDPLR